MDDSQTKLIDVKQLRKGMFVQLDLGWMDHPFPVGSFKIASDEQIKTLRSMGLSQIRYVPSRSDVHPDNEASVGSPLEMPPDNSVSDGGVVTLPSAPAPRNRVNERAQQDRSLELCERRFFEATRQYRRVGEQVRLNPLDACRQSQELVGSCVSELLGNGESVIRLLNEVSGDRSATHPINVMIISLLLGQALGLDQPTLVELGQAALLHDLGKLELPDRVRSFDDHFTSAEYRLYQEHVERSVQVAQRMGLSAAVMRGIAQHHEMADGSGFPLRLKGEVLEIYGKVIALVNRYDNLCNPARMAIALTPHEALSVIFAQMKARFDSTVLGAFIRMMGVYPPGSVVQLVNDRYALVVSVNSSRPLRPRILVHDPQVPRSEALIIDLEQAPELGIKRSLKASQLPKAAMDYLSPRQRICYFFERAVSAPSAGEALP
jgi:HD-GYP domain-containing protein (c-di-GMP phosphodiesterase class II)